MSDSHTLHFIALQGSRDQPSAKAIQVYWSAVSSPSAWISAVEVMVVAMGTIATSIVIAEWMVPVSPARTKGSLEDGGAWQRVNYLLTRKCL